MKNNKNYQYFLSIFLIYLFCVPSFSQNKIDSIEQLIQLSDDDSLKYNWFNQLRRLTVYKDPKVAASYTLKMITTAQKRGDYRAEMIGQIYLGNTHYAMGQYEKALQAFVLAEAYFSQTKDTSILANVYNGMAAAYENSGSDTIVLNYFTKAYRLFKALEDGRRSAITLNNMGNIYEQRENYEKAISLISQAVGLIEDEKPSKYWATVNINLANIYSLAGFIEKSDFIFNETAILLDKTEDPFNYMNAQIGLGNNFLLKKQYHKAINYFKKANIISVQNNFMVDRPDILFKLSKAYEHSHQPVKALSYLQRHLVLKDSIFSNEKDKNLANAIQQYESQKKEKELIEAQLNLEKTSLQKRNFLLTAIASVLLTLIALWFLFFISKTNKVLKSQKSVIQKNLDEKEILLNEIHHRVKNNLQIVSSLLNLQSRTVKDVQAKAAIKEGQDRIKSMALIHQNLYDTENIRGMSIRKYIGKLSETLFRSYNINPEKIRFENKAENIPLDIDTLIPLGLILNELISNALKHAFPAGVSGQVTIIFKKKNGQLLLKVADNGVGQPENEQTDNHSFGMSLIKAFLKKLDATMDISQKDGFCVEILINNYKLASQ